MAVPDSSGDLLMQRVDPRETIWRVKTEGETVGTILYQPWGDEDRRWQWSITILPGSSGPRSGVAASLAAVQDDFRRAWRSVRQQIGDEGWAAHMKHERDLERRRRFGEELQRRRARGDLSFPAPGEI